MPELVKNGGTWKEATPYVKHNGVWVKPKSSYVKYQGVWREVFRSNIALSMVYTPQNYGGWVVDYAYPGAWGYYYETSGSATTGFFRAISTPVDIPTQATIVGVRVSMSFHQEPASSPAERRTDLDQIVMRDHLGSVKKTWPGIKDLFWDSTVASFSAGGSTDLMGISEANWHNYLTYGIMFEGRFETSAAVRINVRLISGTVYYTPPE